MKGLILKDFYCLKKTLSEFLLVAFMVLILAIMFIISAKSGNISRMIATTPEQAKLEGLITQEEFYSYFQVAIWMVLILSVAMSVAVLECFKADRKAGFAKLLFSLPAKVGEIVGARYLAAIGYLLLGTVFATISALCLSFALDSLVFTELLSVIFFSASVMLLVMSIIMPLLYFFGANKLGFIMAGLIVIPYVLIVRYIIWSDVDISLMMENVKHFVETKGIAVFGCAVVVFALSYFCARAILIKKRNV